MNCCTLDKILNVKGCTDTTPLVYFDELFLTVKKLAEIANEDQLKGVELFTQKRQIAFDMVLQDLKCNLKDFTFSEVLEFKIVGKDSNTFLAAEPQERGFEILQRKDCDLAFWEIDCLTLCKQTPGPADVLVYLDDTLFETLNFEGTYPDKLTYVADKVRFVTENLDVCDTDNEHYDTCSCNCANVYEHCIVRGYNDGKASDKTFGLTAKVILKCGFEQIICNEKQFAYLLAYKTYTLILEQVQLTDRYSQWIVGNKDQIAAELAKFEEGFVINDNHIEGRYWQELHKVNTILENKLKSIRCACIENAAPILVKSWN